MSMKWHVAIHPYPVANMVPSTDGKKWVKPDIRAAKRLGLLPSLTSVIDVDKDNLVDWQIRQAIHRCAVMPYAGGSDPATHHLIESEYKEYEQEILNQMEESLSGYADDGKEVHANLERYFRGQSWSGTATANIIEVLTPRLAKLGVVRVDPEVRIGGPDFGIVGTPDLPGYDKDGKLVWIGDLKRKSEKQFKITNTEASLGPNYQLQLGGYLWLLGGDVLNVQLDQILSCRETNEAKIIPYENGERWSTAFYHHWYSWQHRKDLIPAHIWAGEGASALRAQHAAIIEYNEWIVNKQ